MLIWYTVVGARGLCALTLLLSLAPAKLATANSMRAFLALRRQLGAMSTKASTRPGTSCVSTAHVSYVFFF